MTLQVKDAENKKRLFECKDSQEESGHKLLVTVRATHAGVVNGNMRFYRPDRMAQSLGTWTPAGRIPNPVLIHHDKHGDCFGRVMTAKYVDLSDEYLPDFVELKNNFFVDGRGGKKLGLYDSIDWIVANLQGKREDYPGLGYTELGLKITHPDAIRKILDEEFMGVSVGFGSDSGICSICHTDWAKDGQCEHKLGRHYNDKLCFLVTGKHINKEVSFVNFPADVHARVTGTQGLKEMADSLAVRFYFLGLPLRQQAAALNQDIREYSDSLEFLDSDIELVSEAEMDKTNVDELIVKAKGELAKEDALELRKTLDSLADAVEPADKRRVKRALVNLDSVIRKNGWTDSMTKEQVEARIAGLTDALKGIEDAAAKAALVSALEADAKTFGVEFTPPDLTDKIADPAPPPAAAVVENADEKKDEPAKTETPVSFVEEVTKDLKFKDSEAGKSFVAALAQLEKCAAAIGDDEDWAAREALYILWEKINKTKSLEYYKQRLSKEDSTDMVVSKDEWNQIHDELAALDGDFKKLEQTNDVLLKTNRTLVDEQKQILAKELVFGRVFAGDPALKAMDAEGLKAEIAKKASRSLASLTDAVEDLMDSLPALMRDAQGAKPAAPAAGENTDSQAAVTAKEINDNAQVDGAKEEPGGDLKDSATAGEGTQESPFVMPMRRADLLGRKLMARKVHQQYKKTE